MWECQPRRRRVGMPASPQAGENVRMPASPQAGENVRMWESIAFSTPLKLQFS